MHRKLRNLELDRLSVDNFKSAKKSPIVVVLDNVRSMHNVGSIFRTSDGFLIEKIYLCGITATPPHRDIRKTALGAEDSIDWEYVENAVALIEQLKETHEICALEQTTNSVSLRAVQFHNKPIVLIVGNEIDGVQQELIDMCDQVIEIPQFGMKHSFNVSVSTGIALWELFNKMRNA